MIEMLIGDQRVGARSSRELQIVNPANKQVLDSAPEAAPEDVDLAVGAASKASRDWATTDPEQRAALIRKGLALVEENQKEIAKTLTSEQGKPFIEAMGEISHFIHGMTFYADLSGKVPGAYHQLPSTLGPSFGMVIRRPVGVAAGIIPSNYPLTLMGTKVGPALVAGNTIVIKPAETTPLATLRVAELFVEAGLPPGVLNVITGGPQAGEALIGHDDVRRVAFTGETSTGRRVMEIAGPQFKRVTLELGGSDPVIVCPDADIKKAVKNIIIGRYWNAGQSCLAIKRAYVFEDVYDEFLEGLVAGVERYEPGDGAVKAEKPKIRIGPLHTAGQREIVAEQLKDAVDRGAKIASGGLPDESDGGYFFTPTVITDAPHDSRAVQEEVFGPVLPVFKVRDIDEAIHLANDSRYGLGSSIWTYNVKWIHKAAQEIETGMTWVNQIHYGYDELPFGGLKHSGYGKEHGIEALDYYFELKSVAVGDVGS
jgi:succinate-semialdehyde dehydrogenase / glutarate-semialdehyde dehydrogenase